MTTATTETALDAERYLKEVTPHLAALPEEERTELLEDLAQHLREIAAEDGPPLRERLGPPAAYAAELLASAGVVPQGGPQPRLLARAAAATESIRSSALGREVVSLMPVLRPAWWVARGYLAVLLLSAADSSGFSRGDPIPRLAGHAIIGLLAVAVAIPLSVRLGQRRLARPARLAVMAGNAVLAVFALSYLGAGTSGGPVYATYYSEAPDGTSVGCLSTGAGRAITNLYAYDTEGRLLDPVLLYDQSGQPIDNLCPNYDDRGRRLATEYRRDVNGAPVINAFPRRQSAYVRPEPPLAQPGFSIPDPTVPVTPPPVVVPRLATTTTTAAPVTTVPSG